MEIEFIFSMVFGPFLALVGGLPYLLISPVVFALITLFSGGEEPDWDCILEGFCGDR